MFIYSAKMDKKKLATILACLGVVAIVLILVFAKSCGGEAETGSMPSVSENPETVEALGSKATQKLLKKARIREAADAAELLTNLGWQVDPNPVETLDVVIPAEFSEVYKKYNELQLSQGFDLTKYAGQTATRWTMRVNGHPSGEEEVYATLLVINSRVVGGDVCAARVDGFMHGLLPESYTSGSGASVYVEPTAVIPEETDTASGEDMNGEEPVMGK